MPASGQLADLVHAGAEEKLKRVLCGVLWGWPPDSFPHPAELQEGKVTKKFDKAKAETIGKWSGVLEAIRLAKKRKVGRCSFCQYYRKCAECPIEDLCCGDLHRAVNDLLEEVEAKVIEGLSLLEKVEEKA